MKVKKIIAFALLLIVAVSCDHGIAPLPLVKVEPGFSGTIKFLGTWPAGVVQTHVVLFKNPLRDSTDFNVTNIKYISESIPFGVKEYSYSTKSSGAAISNVTPGDYGYLAVAQSKKALSLNRKDWFIVGVFVPNGDSTKAGKFTLPENTFLKNVDIICDFDHPPVQPPGGKAAK